ncbi:MAG TPA: hypothetical protein VH559_17425, partial [Gemmatimonadaceae bacterium]
APIARMNGGTVERWNGGTVERWNGGTVERWNGKKHTERVRCACLFAISSAELRNTNGTSTEVDVPFAFHKPRRSAEVLKF